MRVPQEERPDLGGSISPKVTSGWLADEWEDVQKRVFGNVKKKNSRYLFIEKAIKKILFEWGWGRGSAVDRVLSITETLDSVHLAPASICFTEVKLALCNGTVTFCCCCFDGTGDSYRGGGSAPATVSV